MAAAEAAFLMETKIYRVYEDGCLGRGAQIGPADLNLVSSVRNALNTFATKSPNLRLEAILPGTSYGQAYMALKVEASKGNVTRLGAIGKDTVPFDTRCSRQGVILRFQKKSKADRMVGYAF